MAQDCKTFSSVTPANHFTTTETTRRESLDPLITESKSPTQASSFWDRKFTPFGIRSKFKEAAALLVGTSREASAAPHRELQDVSSETSSDIAELPEGTTAFSGLSPLEAAALNRNLASANALLKQESAELHEQELVSCIVLSKILSHRTSYMFCSPSFCYISQHRTRNCMFKNLTSR